MPTLTAKEEEIRHKKIVNEIEQKLEQMTVKDLVDENTYNIQIQETLTIVIPVEATSYEEAERIAAEMYNNEEVILSADDFSYVTFSNADEEKET